MTICRFSSLNRTVFHPDLEHLLLQDSNLLAPKDSSFVFYVDRMPHDRLIWLYLLNTMLKWRNKDKLTPQPEKPGKVTVRSFVYSFKRKACLLHEKGQNRPFRYTLQVVCTQRGQPLWAAKIPPPWHWMSSQSYLMRTQIIGTGYKVLAVYVI